MKIFLSAVTSQFKACRDALASDLRAIGCEVRVQEDFQQGPRTLIEQIEGYVASCDRVIALVGDAFGMEASGSRVPEVMPPRSYTQWEYHFAMGGRIGASTAVRKDIFLYYASAAYLREHPTTEPPEFNKRQQSFAEQIKNTGEHWVEFDNLDQLCRLVLRDGWQMKERPSKAQNLPYRSLGTLFKGRDTMLARLRERLVAGSAVRQDDAVLGPAQVVHGLGGVGKTRLAVEFAWRHADSFNALLFVAAESVSDLHKNLAALSGPLVLRLGLPDDAKEKDKMAAAVRWLQEHPQWFLILDNVDEEETAVAVSSLLGELRGGSVLITSQLKHWNLMVEPLDLDVMTEADSAAYLLAATADRRIVMPTDEDDANALAHDLDGLALALEQAAAFIKKNHLGFRQYSELLRRSKVKVLAWFDKLLMTDCRSSVGQTWHAACERISPSARDLLHLCAWLSTEPIPCELLGDIFDPRREALAELDGLSLAKRSADGAHFRLHGLVQAVTQHEQITPMSAGDGNAPVLAALAAAGALLDSAAARDSDDEADFKAWNELQPHITKTLEHLEVHNIMHASRLPWALARFCYRKAAYNDARQHIDRALAIDRNKTADGAGHIARDLRLLSKVLKDTNDVSAAEAAAKEALDIEEQAARQDAIALADSLVCLGEVYFNQGRLIEREPLY
jgi:tetratricopeptide (TPR) repeat protein